MKIKKIYQGIVPENKILDAYSTSNTDTYSCNYINNGLKENIITNQEIATNEYIDGYRVYKKRFSFTNQITAQDRLTIAHGITNINEIWVDNSESYIQNVGDHLTFSFPLVLYTAFQVDAVQPYCDFNNLYIISQTTWGTNWKKTIVLKYTKTTD